MVTDSKIANLHNVLDLEMQWICSQCYIEC